MGKRSESAKEARESAEEFDFITPPGNRMTQDYEQYMDRKNRIHTDLQDVRQELGEINKKIQNIGVGSEDFSPEAIEARKRQKEALEQEKKNLKQQEKGLNQELKQFEKEPFTGQKFEADPEWGAQKLDLAMEVVTEEMLQKADPKLVGEQQKALDSAFEIYDSGGYTSSEKAQIRQAQRQAERYEQAQRGAVEEGMAARGMTGGGAGIAGALAAQQGGADRAAASADAVAIAGQQRALQGLSMAGTQANTMRAADDAINAFNTQYRRGVQQRNNQLENTMRIDESTREMRNDQARFANEMNLAGARSGAGFTGAEFLNLQAQQQTQNTMQAIQMGLDVAKEGAKATGAGLA